MIVLRGRIPCVFDTAPAIEFLSLTTLAIGETCVKISLARLGLAAEHPDRTGPPRRPFMRRTDAEVPLSASKQEQLSATPVDLERRGAAYEDGEEGYLRYLHALTDRYKVASTASRVAGGSSALLAIANYLELRLGHSAQPDSKFGWPKGIDFFEGFNPGTSSLFARARDPVAISLLQARLTELETGLEIVPIGEYEW